ncbi:hypothetical protein TR75_04005 [Hydrogenibacillus schlegelii]|nr:hypothetical protein TR75_04005 [Hydrogenibacillus schlegelii]
MDEGEDGFWGAGEDRKRREEARAYGERKENKGDEAGGADDLPRRQGDDRRRQPIDEKNEKAVHDVPPFWRSAVLGRSPGPADRIFLNFQ